MKRLVVLDTNCLLQSLPSQSPYHKIWQDFLDGTYILCVSNETFPKVIVIGLDSFLAELNR